MRVIIESQILAKALDRAKGVVVSNSEVLAARSVLLEAAEGTLHLVAHGSYMTYRESLVCEVEAPGALAVPIGQLSQLASVAPKGSQVLLEVRSSLDLHVHYGQSKFKLPGLPPDTMPPWSVPESAPWPAPEGFLDLLARCAVCMSTEDARKYLHGVFIEAGDEANQIVLTATDSYVLYSGTLTCKGTPGLPEDPTGRKGFILPDAAVKLLPRVAGTSAFKVSCDRVRCAFETDDGRLLITRLIDDKYPPWERVIPPVSDSNFLCEAPEIERIAVRMSIVGQNNKTGRAINLRLLDGELLVAGNSADGAGLDRLKIDYSGDKIDFSVNARYLSRWLSAAGEVLRVYTPAGLGKAIRIESEGRPGEMGIIMGMKDKFPEHVLGDGFL